MNTFQDLRDWLLINVLNAGKKGISHILLNTFLQAFIDITESATMGAWMENASGYKGMDATDRKMIDMVHDNVEVYFFDPENDERLYISCVRFEGTTLEVYFQYYDSGASEYVDAGKITRLNTGSSDIDNVEGYLSGNVDYDHIYVRVSFKNNDQLAVVSSDYRMSVPAKILNKRYQPHSSTDFEFSGGVLQQKSA